MFESNALWCVWCRVLPCVACRVCVVRAVWCGTLKAPCVDSRRLHVYIRNVPVYAGNTRTCSKACARVAGIHGDVLNVHTGGVLNAHTARGVCVCWWRGTGRGEEREGGQRDTPTPKHTATHTPTHTPSPTHCTPSTHTHTTYTHKRTTHNTEHTRCHHQFCLPKFAHVGLSLDPRGSPKKPLDLTQFKFEKRSRTTCSRFLQSFALPDKAFQFQQS